MRLVAKTVAILLLCSSAFAQISLPDRIDPYQPIVAGCDCIVPKNGELQVMWSVDPASKWLACDGDRKIYIWAAPGDHWVEAVTVIKLYRTIKVFVPDPNFPSDPTKAKLEEIKIIDAFNVDRYKKAFVVGTPGPGPAPGPAPPPGPPPPGPGPTPTPTTPFATEVQNWLKALPSGVYTKEKALAIAGNYQSIAAQAVATSGWDLVAFVTAMKPLNVAAIGDPAQVEKWGTAFFSPLAKKQFEMFEARGLNDKDTAGIAKIWIETAEAIKAAAF